MEPASSPVITVVMPWRILEKSMESYTQQTSCQITQEQKYESKSSFGG